MKEAIFRTIKEVLTNSRYRFRWVRIYPHDQALFVEINNAPRVSDDYTYRITLKGVVLSCEHVAPKFSPEWKLEWGRGWRKIQVEILNPNSLEILERFIFSEHAVN